MAKDTSKTWKQVREEVARATNIQAEIEELTGWAEERVTEEAEQLQHALSLKDSSKALEALLEMFKMREGLVISKQIDERLQFTLLRAMWLRKWSVE